MIDYASGSARTIHIKGYAEPCLTIFINETICRANITACELALFDQANIGHTTKI
jgi:hypothetical protein